MNYTLAAIKACLDSHETSPTYVFSNCVQWPADCCEWDPAHLCNMLWMRNGFCKMLVAALCGTSFFTNILSLRCLHFPNSHIQGMSHISYYLCSTPLPLSFLSQLLTVVRKQQRNTKCVCVTFIPSVWCALAYISCQAALCFPRANTPETPSIFNANLF